jgi:putative hydrolase of the HAD superfamily
MAIQAIFFDAAGTLIKTARPVGEIYASIASSHGIEVSAMEVSARFRTCFGLAPPLAFPGALPADLHNLERAWWKTLVYNVLEPEVHQAQFEDCFAELFEYFAQPHAWMLYPDVAETLAALSGSHLSLSIISNFDSRLHRIIEGLGIARWFTTILISSQVGAAKPAPEIFRAALAKHGVKPENALHVGDSEEADAHGAINAGLTGVLIDREKQNGEELPILRISRLSDLPLLLERLQKDS